MHQQIGIAHTTLRLPKILLGAVMLSAAVVSPVEAQWSRRLPEISIWVERGIGAAKAGSKSRETREQREEQEPEQKDSASQREQQAARQKQEAQAQAEHQAKIDEAKRYYNAARESLRHHDLDSALSLLRRAQTLFTEGEDEANAMKMNQAIGFAYTKTGNFSEAVHILKQVLAYYKAKSDTTNAGLTAHSLGASYLGLRQTDEAIEYLKMALEAAYLNASDKNELTLVLFTYGLALNEKSNTEEAIKYLSRAALLSKEIKDTELTLDIISGLADLHLKQNNYQQASTMLTFMLDKTRESDLSRYINTLVRLGEIGIRNRDLNEATIMLTEALTLSRKQGDRAQLAATLHQMGRLSTEKRQREEAKNYLDESLEIYQELKQAQGESAVKASLERLAKLPLTVAQPNTRPTAPTPTSGTLAPSAPRANSGLIEITPISARPTAQPAAPPKAPKPSRATSLKPPVKLNP